jgi:asparagine synthase (glutamine-hydrolysing)
MSGIAGIVNLDGAPVDPVLVERFEEFLRSRGPDNTGRWVDGNVVLVHTLFATTEESRGERQPTSLDGEVWIVADARIDARDDLIRDLTARGRACSKQRPDAELILHAYAVWGEGCVEHLLGDFAFAIWDAREQKLFCARDHFGVKPFFYAHVRDCVIFSNTLDCIREHEDVSDELDELFIADFLLFEVGRDFDRTAFEAIRRLPPACVLVTRRGQLLTRLYWSLPADQPPRFSRQRDYEEHFLHLLAKAVGDRLRTNKAAILISGGLDSSSVAALAKRLLETRGRSYKLTAHTLAYHQLFPFPETEYARIVASFLDIPIYPFAFDQYRPFEGWDQPGVQTPEPTTNILMIGSRSFVSSAASSARVALTGQGGDAVFVALSWRYCRQLLQRGRFGRLAVDGFRHLTEARRWQRLRAGYALAWWKNREGRHVPDIYPEWLNPDLERRLALRDRFLEGEAPAVPQEAVRPEAHRLLMRTFWSRMFEGFDWGWNRALQDVRHPFFDIRLVGFMLSLPAWPWCSEKTLLRKSMQGLLPDEIRFRPKAPMPADPQMAHWKDGPPPSLDDFRPTAELERFVRWDMVPQISAATTSMAARTHLRPVCLSFWLQAVGHIDYKTA